MIYDCLVVGTGAMGSAACWFAARRGWSVLGLDRFPPGHDRGSSHGRARIIRQAYFEHPSYVPLVLEAYNHWADAERQSGQTLLLRTGLLQVGSPQGPVIQGIRQSAAQHGLTVEELGHGELSRRFPMFRYEPGTVGLLETAAGILRVESCVRVMAELAVRCGCQLRSDIAVTGWETGDDGVIHVQTEGPSFAARRLIVTAGAWSGSLLTGMNSYLRVLPRHQYWFDARPQFEMASGCPTWFFETVDGYFYGFPDFDGAGIKLAEHGGRSGPIDPRQVNRDLDARDLARVKSFAERHLQIPLGNPTGHSVCFYTMSPDEHFIVDRLDPAYGEIAYACGFSGHGFKFAPAIGRALVELLEGQRNPALDFLRSERLPAESSTSRSG